MTGHRAHPSNFKLHMTCFQYQQPYILAAYLQGKRTQEHQALNSLDSCDCKRHIMVQNCYDEAVAFCDCDDCKHLKAITLMKVAHHKWSWRSWMDGKGILMVARTGMRLYYGKKMDFGMPSLRCSTFKENKKQGHVLHTFGVPPTSSLWVS